jgi:hypothetical protein
MSNDSFKYYYCLYIWYCTVFSDKQAMNSVIWSRHIKQKCQQIDFVSPSADCSVVLWYEIVIKFYMSNDSFKYYYCLYIWYCTVFSGKLRRIRIFSKPSTLCKLFWYSKCTFPTFWTGILGAVYMMESGMILMYFNH